MVKPDRSDTSASDIVVELSGVCKTFRQKQRSERLRDVFRNLFRPTVREVHALRNIDLRIHRGEIVAYAGPNGAGKSTTVKILSSLLVPDAGTARVLGMNTARDRIRYVGRIGVVFGQRTELWWDQPVAASFEWKRVVWDIPRDRYNRMLDFVKELMGLGEFFNSLTRELSLGQRMRADLGLVLMHEPEILFLDEPTIGVDVLAKRNILEFIKDLNRERHVTVMLTSHDMSELEQIAGRIVMINRGQIAFDGDFNRLRREFGARRRLLIETADRSPPDLKGADLIKSEAGRHEYIFDASQVKIPALLEQASIQAQILDVETHQASIDDVIADIYEKWQK
ncbi:MAG: ATP-binding cassette domain-containing protein [Candidatus Poribacteria bacterium]|nr:ATP-binding cassette domain-containing protein [Candidatus Poribacteria bacterium]